MNIIEILAIGIGLYAGGHLLSSVGAGGNTKPINAETEYISNPHGNMRPNNPSMAKTVNHINHFNKIIHIEEPAQHAPPAQHNLHAPPAPVDYYYEPDDTYYPDPTQEPVNTHKTTSHKNNVINIPDNGTYTPYNNYQNEVEAGDRVEQSQPSTASTIPYTHGGEIEAQSPESSIWNDITGWF